MLIVHVFIQVTPGRVDDFIEATIKNAKGSMNELGVLRFDVLQRRDDKNHFVLVEVYRTKDDAARHKETHHYQQWNQTVADMMAVPRTKQIFDNIYPGEDG
ncbi:MAG: antibiotic biosynthesis monooxygenase [Chloroflexota bacterium]|nr:antibiotic biosynthesis monooxygenase [Chloroflexota bacterium]